MAPAGPRDKQTHDHLLPYHDITKHDYAEVSCSPVDYKGAGDDVGTTSRRRRLAVLDDIMLLWRRYPSWALPALLTFCLVLLSNPLTKLTGAAEPPRQTNGYTDVVTWDNYTLWVHDQRVFLQYVTPCLRSASCDSRRLSGGEFHNFRLPVPELWLDIFQKMSAAGLNHVRYVPPVFTQSISARVMCSLLNLPLSPPPSIYVHSGSLRIFPCLSQTLTSW